MVVVNLPSGVKGSLLRSLMALLRSLVLYSLLAAMADNLSNSGW